MAGHQAKLTNQITRLEVLGQVLEERKKACLEPHDMESNNSDQGESSRSQKKNKPQLLGILSLTCFSPIFKGICQLGTHVGGKGPQQQTFQHIWYFIAFNVLTILTAKWVLQDNSKARELTLQNQVGA